MNRKWRHFATIRASDLQALDAADPDVMNRPDAPDASAWCIHGNAHARVPAARVILHCHPIAITTLSALADPRLLPIDQNTARFFGRHAIDPECGGIADQDAEGIRIADYLATAPTLISANHGVTCIADTVAEAFENLYFVGESRRNAVARLCHGQAAGRDVRRDCRTHRARLGRLSRPGVCPFRLPEIAARCRGSPAIATDTVRRSAPCPRCAC